MEIRPRKNSWKPREDYKRNDRNEEKTGWQYKSGNNYHGNNANNRGRKYFQNNGASTSNNQNIRTFVEEEDWDAISPIDATEEKSGN